MARVLRLVSTVATSLSLCGCILPGDGPSPPDAEFYFPTGMALSSDASRLYVANSDFDLQYNQGTLLAVDIAAAEDRFKPVYCSKNADCAPGLECDLEASPDDVAPSHWCVKKELNNPCGALGVKGDGALGEKTAAERLLFPGRCDAIPLPQFVKGSAQINAFASDLIFRPRPDGNSAVAFKEKQGRIFVTVRGNESLTFADVDWTDPKDPIAELRCGETGFGGKCSSVYSRGEEGDDRGENDRFVNLPPEPNAVAANLRGEVLVVAHQTQPTSSLFINDWKGWGKAGAGTGPQLKFLVGGLPENAIDVISVPEPAYMLLPEQIDYRPAFLLTFRTAAQLVSLRYFADDTDTDPSRPFLTVGGRVDITANSVNWDSRGIAIDTDARDQCETDCDKAWPSKSEELTACLRTCTNVPLGVFVANRTPSSLLIGQTRPNATPTSNDDLPHIYDSIPLSTGPSRVVTGQIIAPNPKYDPENPSGEDEFIYPTRIFVVCFDSRLIYIYDPVLQRIESIIRTGRGPYALSIGRKLDETIRKSTPTGLGYIGMFTDSYVGVVDLDQSHKETYGTIIMTLGNPVEPRASE